MIEQDSVLIELHYLPCIQYFSKLVSFPKVYIEQHENYQKGSYRNRAHIASANGLLRLSIPLEKGKNEQQAIREVSITYHENWQTNHWQAIQSAYGNAPFFDYYADELYPFYHNPYPNLFEFNWNLLQFFLKHIPSTAHIELTHSFHKIPKESICDFRNRISPKEKHHFSKDPQFRAIKYGQVFEEKHGFLPNLSILDALFCMGPATLMNLEASFVP